MSENNNISDNKKIRDNSQDIRNNVQGFLNNREKQDKSKKVFKIFSMFIIGITVLALVVFGFIAVQKQSEEDANAKDTGNISQEQWVPEKVDAYGAFKLGKNGTITDDKEPTIGKTRVDLFFDPHCPYCGIAERAIGEDIVELVNNDTIEMYYTPVAFLDQMSQGTRYSTRATNAIITVAEKSPEHFSDYMKAIYAEDFQPSEGSTYINVTNEQLANLAKEVGVDEEVANLIPNEHYNEWIAKQTERQTEREDLFSKTDKNNAFGTPAIFINTVYDENGEATGARLSLSQDIKTDFNNAIINADKIQ